MLQLELRLNVLLKLLHLDYTIKIQLVYHNGETWHVKAVLEEQQQLPDRLDQDTSSSRHLGNSTAGVYDGHLLVLPNYPADTSA